MAELLLLLPHPPHEAQILAEPQGLPSLSPYKPAARFGVPHAEMRRGKSGEGGHAGPTGQNQASVLTPAQNQVTLQQR